MSSSSDDDNENEVKLWEREETTVLEIPVFRTALPPKILRIRQYVSDDDRFGIHSCVWDGWVACLHFLAERHSRETVDADGSLIVDLGSGTGIVGFGMSLLGYHSLLTDLPDALQLLNENLLSNK